MCQRQTEILTGDPQEVKRFQQKEQLESKIWGDPDVTQSLQPNVIGWIGVSGEPLNADPRDLQEQIPAFLEEENIRLLIFQKIKPGV